MNADNLYAAAATLALVIEDFKKYDEVLWESHFDPEQCVPVDVALKMIAGDETPKDLSDLRAWINRCYAAPDTTLEEQEWLMAIESNLVD